MITGYGHLSYHLVFLLVLWLFLSSMALIGPSSRFAETGEALVSSVDKVIFVGSPGVGKMVRFFWLVECFLA